MIEEKKRYAHGVMIYQCEDCGEVFTMKLETGIEERKNGEPVEGCKPSPFIIRCPYCGGYAKDILFRAFTFPEPRPIRHGERFFANEKHLDCGISTRCGMKWEVPQDLDDPVIAEKIAKDCHGNIIRVHDIVRVADHVRAIEGFSLLAKKLKTTRGMIDAVLRDGIGILVDFPGTAFRSLLLDPRDVEFISHDNWQAKGLSMQMLSEEGGKQWLD